MFDSINKATYLYLREISEPHDNSLRLVVQEAVTNPGGNVRRRPNELAEVAKLLDGTSPIESTEECNIYEIYWDKYAAYLVMNESVASCGNHPQEQYSGNLFRIYSKSNFLDHLANDAQAIIDPMQHFKLICLNHVIDIASQVPPEIREISARTEP